MQVASRILPLSSSLLEHEKRTREQSAEHRGVSAAAFGRDREWADEVREGSSRVPFRLRSVGRSLGAHELRTNVLSPRKRQRDEMHAPAERGRLNRRAVWCFTGQR